MPTHKSISDGIADRIRANYKAAMEDCQIPTGSLASLTATEFYIHTLEHRCNINDPDTPLDKSHKDRLLRIVDQLNDLDAAVKVYGSEHPYIDLIRDASLRIRAYCTQPVGPLTHHEIENFNRLMRKIRKEHKPGLGKTMTASDTPLGSNPQVFPPSWREKLSLLRQLGPVEVWQRDNGSYYVHASSRETQKIGTCGLLSQYGNGDTPQAAIEDDFRIMTTLPADTVIVIDAMGDKRKHFRWIDGRFREVPRQATKIDLESLA